eukprot:CAMPEP_0185773194 /NCGR_PEP_ID=MMETSP1174-20130828/72418_1 /TAXON_ID=35687 /ORGANISM="Dictyocha speculum, Strain CCMP1381" /LENGTH=154 /DNA_ID=CAMNT_0028459767 /DNA_START=48 /DNA_END=513 /DNA_ORIENTATION=+
MTPGCTCNENDMDIGCCFREPPHDNNGKGERFKGCGLNSTKCGCMTCNTPKVERELDAKIIQFPLLGTSWAELRAVVGTLVVIATPVHALELGVKFHAAAVFKIVISHFKQKTTSMAVHYADALELTCASVVRTAAPFMSLQGKFYACAVSKKI